MSEIKENLKELVRSIASTTKQKVSAYNLANEKEDLFTAIGSKVYQLWKDGEAIPECLTEDLVKIVEIEEAIKVIQETQNSNPSEENPVYSDTPAEDRDAPACPQAAEHAAKDDGDVPVIKVEDEEDSEPEDCPQWHLVKAKNEVKPSTTGVTYQIVINNCQDHRKKGTTNKRN